MGHCEAAATVLLCTASKGCHMHACRAASGTWPATYLGRVTISLPYACMQPVVPRAKATALPEIIFPAPTAVGRAGDASPKSPARLPSVLDLSRSGHTFQLAGLQPAVRGFDPTPDTVQLIFSDMLLHAPGAVFEDFEAEGIPYIAQSIDFGRGSRICFIHRRVLSARRIHLLLRALRAACSAIWPGKSRQHPRRLSCTRNRQSLCRARCPCLEPLRCNAPRLSAFSPAPTASSPQIAFRSQLVHPRSPAAARRHMPFDPCTHKRPPNNV